MANRREFIQVGAVAGLAAGVGLSAGGEPAKAGPPSIPLYKAVYDERFADSRAFAAEMDHLGVSTFAIRHDVTPFWLKELRTRWRESPVAIAGLTAECSFLCLEQFARDFKLKVVYRGEHVFHEDGRVRHRFTADGAVIGAADEFAAGTLDWSRKIAALLTRHPPVASRPKATRTAHTPLAGAPPVEEEALASFIIAPLVPSRVHDALMS